MLTDGQEGHKDKKTDFLWGELLMERVMGSLTGGFICY